MYRLRPYDPQDLFTANWREKDKEELRLLGPSAEDLAFYYTKGPAFTFFWHQEILLIAGVVTIWEGLGEAWFRGTPAMYDHKEEVKERTRVVFKSIKENTPYRRIQSAVQEEWATARRFAQFLGMKEEGRMPFFGLSGEHFIRYAITDEE
jgi:hypothetical protein